MPPEDPTPTDVPTPDQVSIRYPILKYFQYAHLPQKLQDISKPYCELAITLAWSHPEGHAEVGAGLRHLLEAKDCAVRAAL